MTELKWALGLALPMCWFACGSDDTTVVVESEHIRLHYDLRTPVCAGTLDFMEGAAVAQAQFLGYEIYLPIDYYLLPPGDWRDGPCPTALACATNGVTIFGAVPAVTHELVHAIEQQQHPVADPLFSEGVAVALGDGRPGWVVEEYGVPLDSFVGANLNIGQYLLAGDFSAYLLARYGPAQFDEVMVRAPRSATNAEVLDAFATVYGMTLEEAVEERWRSGHRFVGGELKVPHCSAPRIEWDGMSLSDRLTIDCNADAVGYDTETLDDLRRVNYVTRHQTIDIATEGIYRMEATQPRGWVNLGWCPMDGDASAPVDAVLLGTPWVRSYDVFAHLLPGRYYVEGWARWPEPATIEWSLAAASPSCAEPIEVNAESPIIFATPRPAEPLVLPLRFTTDAMFIAIVQREDGTDVSSCSDCTLTDCVPIIQEWESVGSGDERVMVVTSSVWDVVASFQFGE